MRSSVLAPVILAVLTVLFIWPLLKIGYTNNLGSLEPATLVLARRVAQDGIWGWYANWYLGFPFRFAGPPASWWLLGAIEKLGIFDLLAVYRILKAVALIAFPISFYFLARRVFGARGPVASFPPAPSINSGQAVLRVYPERSRRAVGSPSTGTTPRFFEIGNSVAFVSSLILMLLPSIGYLFPKFFSIGRQFGFAPSWFGQELSRSMGLALLPICLVLYWRLLEKIDFKNLVLSIFVTSLLFLTDGVTALSLLVGVAAILVIEGYRSKSASELHGHLAQKAVVCALCLGLAFLIDAFYFTPANLRLIASSPSISGIGLFSFIKIMVQAALGLGPAILVIASFKLFNKERLALAFVLLWTLPFVVITLLFYFANPDFLTEYTRFLPEVEMGVALLAGYWVSRMVGWRNKKIFNFQFSIFNFSVLMILIVTLLYSLYSLPWRWQIFRTNPDITKTIEYQIAKWLEINAGPVSAATPVRVFLSGSTAFWLNEFAPETWQVRGGIDQASTHPYWARATYQIRYSPDGQESLLWLKALRVNYLVVHDQSSAEYYHDFTYPEKFERVCSSQSNALLLQPDTSCRLVFDSGKGDRIYQINASMASVASQEGFKSLSGAKVARKDDLLAEYVDWVSGGEPAGFKRSAGGNILTIDADTSKDQVVAVGITYDRGWQAVDSAGSKLTIRSDPFGNLVVFPKSEGEQELYLTFHEGLDLWFGMAVSLATLIFIVFLLPKKLPWILEKAERGWEEEEI